MRILSVDADGMRCAYRLWKESTRGVPYCFDVDQNTWIESVLNDTLCGEKMFSSTEVLCALQGGRMLGFVQIGTPRFLFTPERTLASKGVGILRQIVFSEQAPEVGDLLLEAASSRFGSTLYAHYHALGLRCCAYHGKLHESMAHVEAALLRQGFRVEHQNAYCCLQLSKAHLSCQALCVSRATEHDKTIYALHRVGRCTARAVVRSLGGLTGGAAAHVAYLVELSVAADVRSQGVGGKFVRWISAELHRTSHTEIHTDTAAENTSARRFYEREGFEARGMTRSYVFTP